MWFCSNCGAMNEDSIIECNNCNENRNKEIKSEIIKEKSANFNVGKKRKKSKITSILLILVGIFLALALIGSVLPDEENISNEISQEKNNDEINEKDESKLNNDISSDSEINPWDAVAEVERLTDSIYAGTYNESTKNYENEPKIIKNDGHSYYVIPVMDKFDGFYFEEFYFDIFTGDIYDSTWNNFWILKDSDSRILTSSDIEGLSKDDIRFARNEIFARHGYIFNSEDLSNYFASKAWYRINLEYNDDMMSDIEKNNVDFLLYYENN